MGFTSGHDVEGEEAAREILTRLRYSNKLVDKVALLVRWHMFSVHAGSTDKALKRFIRRVGKRECHGPNGGAPGRYLGLGQTDDLQCLGKLANTKGPAAGYLDSDATLTISDLAIGA